MNDFGTLLDLNMKIAILLKSPKTLSTFAPWADSKISVHAKLRK